MKKRRVLLLANDGRVPPESLDGLSDTEVDWFAAEYDVREALRSLGHEVLVLGVRDELTPIREAIDEFRPHIAFNLLEEFQGLPVYDHNVVAYLELLGLPYTGCSPRAMVIARDKALTKKILHYHRISSPRFAVYRRRRKRRTHRRLSYPLIVKSTVEESSKGISQASVVTSEEKLLERVEFVHEKVGTDALVEEYVDGRELYVGVFGSQRIQVLPVWELDIGNLPADSVRIATEKVKWDLEYQRRHRIRSGPAKKLSPEVVKKMSSVTRRVFRLLGLESYSRLDFRLREDGRPFLLEANPNPDISKDGELAGAAAAAGIEYPQLIQKVLNLGLRRRPAVYS